MKKKYVKPEMEVINLDSETLMLETSVTYEGQNGTSIRISGQTPDGEEDDDDLYGGFEGAKRSIWFDED